MRYYPIHLDLKGRQVLVVGGGTVAEGKVRQLVSAGARVRLVSPTIEATLDEARQRRVDRASPAQIRGS